MFQIDPQVYSVNPMLNLNPTASENTFSSNLTELNSLWVSHLLRQQSNHDHQYSNRHPLKASVEASFFARQLDDRSNSAKEQIMTRPATTTLIAITALAYLNFRTPAIRIALQPILESPISAFHHA